MPVGAAIGTAVGGLGAGAMTANAQKKAANAVSGSTDRAADYQNEQFNRVLDLNLPGYRVQQGALALYGAALGLPTADLMRSPTAGAAPRSAPTLEGGVAQPQGALGRLSLVRGPDGKYYTQDYLDDFQRRSTQAGEDQADSTVDLSFVNGLNIPEFVKSQPGYAEQRAEGLRGIQGSAAARGTLRSGRTLAALEQYGQRTFGSYYDQWLSRVGGLATGTGAKDQIASAGQTTAANLGSLGMQGAAAQGQGAISSANAWSQGLGGAFGTLSAIPWGSMGSGGPPVKIHEMTHGFG